MNSFLEDAAAILDTAVTAGPGEHSDLAILVDRENQLRIVFGTGWTVEGLRNEYQASSAYTVGRSQGSVTVEAERGADRCTLRKSTLSPALAVLGTVVPHHLLTLPAGSGRLLNA